MTKDQIKNKAALIILDGWGMGDRSKSDAIFAANTPFIDHLYTDFPSNQLTTYGEVVGLPKGQMGNSEVGHLNIGAGRTVYQDLLKINRAFDNEDFYQNESILKIRSYCLKNEKALHLLGLISDGGVHSNIDHLIKTALFFDRQGIKVFIHAFTDGRDTDPHSGLGHLKNILRHIDGSNIEVASICGRYYAMDRDKRWERTKRCYDLLINGEGIPSTDLIQSIEASYESEESDEFIQPIIHSGTLPASKIKDGDAVFFINFRTDRPRQLTQALSQKDFPEFGMKKIDLFFSTMTEYDESFENLNIIYPKQNLDQTLGQVLSDSGKTQLRAAETEKYPHVTFFFNGGREEPFSGEDRILVNSPKVATYDLQPEMSAQALTDEVIKALENQPYDFLCINYANADMVGHTGNYAAVINACETLDQCVERLVGTLRDQGFSILIIADHGNADYMINENGTPNTAHTKNPVPVILIHSGKKLDELNTGDLTDIAPTLLKLLDLKPSPLMTGKALF